MIQYAVASDGTPLHWVVVAPDNQSRPAVILLPGGGFKALYNIPSQVSQDLSLAGYHVFSNTQYRIAPPNKLAGQTSDGRFSDQTNDVELAVAAALGDPRCDGNVFVVGGSAGGSHAMYLASRNLVKAAVGLSPATEFDDVKSRLDPNFRHDVDNYAPNNLAAASPNNMLVTAESPIFISAFSQDHMPAPQYDLAVSKLQSLGAPYQPQLVTSQGHSWDLWPFVKNQVISFLGSI